MLRLLFRRFKELVDEADSLEKASQIVPGAPASVVKAFTSSLDLEQYLSLDDHAMTEFLKCCSNAKDSTGLLKDLSEGLLYRRLFKAIDASNYTPNSVVQFSAQVVDLIRSQNRNPVYDFAVDDPSDTPYKPYDPDDENPATQIYIKASDDRQREISTQSAAIETLKKRYYLLRYYSPEMLRDEISAIAKSILR
jgi:HD superfamily phosphohydrolase